MEEVTVGSTHSTDRQDSGLHVPMLSDLPFILAQTSFAIILACVDLAFVFFLCHTVNYGGKQGQGIWKVYKTYGLTVTLSCSVVSTLPFLALFFLSVVLQPKSCLCPLIVEVSRSHTIRHTYLV